jgi:TRAP-type mannitol/chloroaromatic compound transport system permease small subunit
LKALIPIGFSLFLLQSLATAILSLKKIKAAS